MGHDLALLLANKLRQWRNGWIRYGRTRDWRRRLAPLSALVWLAFLGYGSVSAIRFLQENLGPAAGPVVLETVAGAFLGGMMLALVNGMRQVFDTFFLADDLPLLLSTPLSRRAVFASRLLEGMLDNGTYAAMMVLPPGAAFLLTSHAPWTAYGWLLLAFLLLLAGITALSILLDLAIVRLLPASRARQVMVSINMALVLGIVLLYNAFSTGLVQPEQAVPLLAGEPISRQTYLPTVWMARSLAALVPGYHLSFWRPAALLVGTTAGLTGLAVWLSGWLYGQGWGAAQESPRRRRRTTTARPLRAHGGSPRWAFIGKDLRYFVRDSRSWGMLLFGLTILVILSLNLAHDGDRASPLMETGTAVLLPAMGGLLSVRWLLAAFARDGEAWWVIQASPLGEEEIFTAKFTLNYAISLLYAGATVVFFAAIAPVSLLWLPAALTMAAVLTAGTTAIGLAVAAWRADMSWPPQRQRDTVGAYALMALVTIYVGLPVALLSAADRLPWMAAQLRALFSLPSPTLTSLLAAAYLPVTAAVWAGMRTWALGSLRRLRVEQ